MEQQTDAIVLDEVVRGFRIETVPPNIQSLLEMIHEENENIPVWTKIRFERLTPRGKALVGDETVNQFNADVRSGKYMSREEMRKLAIERGMWTEDEEVKMNELQAKSTNDMQALYLEGFDRNVEWLKELGDRTSAYLTAIKESDKDSEVKLKVPVVLDRWLAYHETNRAQYTELFAEDQGRPEYSADADFVYLVEQATTDEVADHISEMESLKRKLQKLAEIIDMRNELDKLTEKRAKLFTDTIESRRDRATELANVYYGTKVLNDKNKPIGRLTPNFNDMWDLPDGVLNWLLLQAYFFYEGVPEHVKEYMAAWGFLPAERERGSSQASDESPVPQSGKSDTSESTPTLADSLTLPLPKTLTTAT